MGEATEFATPISDDEEQLDAFHEDSPVRYRHMDQVIGDELNLGQAVRMLALARRGRPWRV
jgi:hypothetical protein